MYPYQSYRVYIGIVPTGYLSFEALEQTIQQGLVFCGGIGQLEKTSNIFMKTDLPFADDKLARNCYTHPEILRASLKQVFAHSPNSKVNLGAHFAFDLPAQKLFKKAHAGQEMYLNSGYMKFKELYGSQIELLNLNKAPHHLYKLNHVKNQLNDVLAPALHTESGLTIYVPKIKNTGLTDGLSAALTLNCGSMLEPDYSDKIQAMQEVAHPSIIISDGIVVYNGGSNLTGRGYEMGFILVSNNAIAHDWVAAKILGLEAENIDYLKAAIQIAQEQGTGPTSFGEIELGGSNIEGLNNLRKKTFSLFQASGRWDMAQFKQRFEAESKFPIEISCVQSQTAPTDATFRILNWLFFFKDSAVLSKYMRKWPKFALLFGKLAYYPVSKLIFCLENENMEPLKNLVSQHRFEIRTGFMTLSYSQLRNGRWHWIVRISAKDTGVTFFKKVSFAITFGCMTVGSFFRITWPLFKFRILTVRDFFSFLVGKKQESLSCRSVHKALSSVTYEKNIH